MITLIAIAVLGFAFYLFNELEDRTVRGHNVALWPNSDHPSTAKWKYPYKNYKKRWYHFGVYPIYEERFAYSSTVFVWLTDTEHFYQFMKLRCLDVAFFIIDYRFGIAYICGTIASRLFKEIFIKQLD